MQVFCRYQCRGYLTYEHVDIQTAVSERCLLLWQKTAVFRGYSVVESWISHGWFVVTPILRPVKITMSFVLYSKEIKPAREQYRINPGMTRISASVCAKRIGTSGSRLPSPCGI